MRRSLSKTASAPQPVSATQEDGGGGLRAGEGKFDTNMVIILAALLCALICVLGLNSIVRCLLRCGRRIASETPEGASARLSSIGVKKRALRRIPVTIYGSCTNILATECTICLGEFTDGEKIRILPICNHGFHLRCIDTWLASHSSCPTCRHSLLDRMAIAGSGTGGELEAAEDVETENPSSTL
ncbi:hypothetical protein HPP92_015590 [Vanilla planifolia]|uniref:RING-type domain-containing protein n=1 Tax=Vanilla planifolia TaxID=51239 RepID=A0A835QSF9_VANPL|nr:hypothetical protein HPP92_015590 [Vanilla planifolia]